MRQQKNCPDRKLQLQYQQFLILNIFFLKNVTLRYHYIDKMNNSGRPEGINQIKVIRSAVL